ncbi:DNA mismatch repair protein MutS domain protein [Candidatus Moduliflexus flocculans]|uniref:DNA mismatch repair protein MutS domain protein n=1 Tax=Candidatus Moduliflexus flocculans TaxID=1499966 RepID=A0A081BS02_9BACT|nr:DNA mismatch repair protein MutS domain protein [Candidatus Moduliflexus flocculans]
MSFYSILYETSEQRPQQAGENAPAFFADLNLDQVVESVTKGKQEYQLRSFFYAPLTDRHAIMYRQQVARDLENEMLVECLKAFATKMSGMRSYLRLIEKLYYHYHQAGWFLEAVNLYCDAVANLAQDMNRFDLQSRGLTAFRDYLTAYANSDAFMSLLTETNKLKTDLATIEYCILIKGNCVKVRTYELESDYTVEVEEIFKKFHRGNVKDYRAKLALRAGMGHVEAKILEFVAKLHPAIFAHLDQYCEQHHEYLDATISMFDREIQFYIAYREYVANIQQTGLNFCYPEIATTSKDVHDYAGFDLALAYKQMIEHAPVVCNDFSLKGAERIIIVSGPNQGGKTTFARMFGQLHYLASLGLLVPGRKARLFLCDRLLTHFEKEEDISNLRGKLQDELVRIHAILEQATSHSLIIMNEIFTSTTLEDAVFLSKKIMARIIELDGLCVCVTFMDELASLGAKTISMVSTVVPENPTLRTYKIVRKPPDGLAYALSIAEKYRLTYACIKERFAA